MATPKVYGVDQTIATLRLVEGSFVTAARKDLKNAAEPVATNIMNWIPNSPPLSGMRHSGRTSWDRSNIKATVRTNFSKRAAKNEHSIISIWVGGKKGTKGAAGLQIADMAGKRGKSATGQTREYTRRGRTQSHRLNGQGSALMDNLGSRYSSPSRFVWRGAMSQLPKVTADVLVILEGVSAKLNAKLVYKK
jgi:hypothetical protein